MLRRYFLPLALVLLSACQDDTPDNKPLIRPIAWTEVSASPLEQVRRLSGTMAPVEAANLSFEVNGKVDAVKVNLGESVKQGQELARLNQRSFNLSLQSAQATLEQAKANLTEAENEYQRYAELVEQGVVSKSGFDNAKAAFESTRSAVGVAQAQLDIARKNLHDSVLLAPYDGIITKRLIEPSQQISAGQTVFEIEGEHGLEVRLMVPETIIRELHNGMPLPVRFPVLPNLTLSGRVSEIGTRAEAANAFPIVILLNDHDQRLRAGMTAEVDITFQGSGRSGFSGRSLRVPVSALAADTGKQLYLFVYDPAEQKVFKRQVQTENIINNEVYISQGVEEGEIVATAGVAFLRDGQQVTLLDKQVRQFN
ncbi:efflux RND transporter periplasmic adaptor subunit [Bowmanella pacifica]|uniref:Resistance-nodulation-cell division (RND) efflux membrane fusion protein n=1 Tax=Bowmanella pacifica TaxID=502051 RepID=A0A917Z0Q6_9ALTE|nr:efflux RND transporter periplasmic adaptor subunit [Bowmanella pacifica]GGO71596.1 resistance-nodulation-cell division (RND) efflux membrane fusion protein [Bowmanella pacifica]